MLRVGFPFVRQRENGITTRITPSLISPESLDIGSF